MNDYMDGRINWKKIRRGLPPRKNAADDRPPTREEIKKLLDYPDRRIKVIVLVMLSSGIRIAAWDYLKWKHIKPFRDDNIGIIAARLVVYAGEPEQYITFITPEAYDALEKWMAFLASFGEKITSESPLMRDAWQTTNVKQWQRIGLATYPKRLKSSGIKRLLERALWEQGIRQQLEAGQKRHEFKAAHGFRKFYDINANTAMRSINVELTMGHSTGISESYYKPTEDEILKDYLNAIPKLTINEEAEINRELTKLRLSTVENSYIAKSKFEEKDNQIASLNEKVNELESSLGSQLQLVISAITNSDDIVRNKLAKQLIKNGVFKPD
jgi:integrase